jgi:hypothetical protein
VAQVALKILAALRDKGFDLLLKFFGRDHAGISPGLLVVGGAESSAGVVPWVT